MGFVTDYNSLCSVIVTIRNNPGLAGIPGSTASTLYRIVSNINDNMTDIIATIVLIVLAVIACIVLFFILKNGFKLLINATAGVVILLILTFFNILPQIGDITVTKVVVCTVGGVIGVALIVILSFFGITI